MNWNEFRFKWFVLCVFMLCAFVIITGCSTNTPEPELLEPAPHIELEGLPPCDPAQSWQNTGKPPTCTVHRVAEYSINVNSRTI